MRPHRKTASDSDRARAAAYSSQVYSGTTPEEEELYARFLESDDDLVKEVDQEGEEEDEPLSAVKLIIKDLDLDVVYNDAETGSQQADIKVNFTWDDSPESALFTIVYFSETRTDIVERIAEEINFAINLSQETDNENYVNDRQVRRALGKNLAFLMNQMEELQEEYDDQQARYL